MYTFFLVDAAAFYFSGAAVSPFEADAALGLGASCFVLALAYAIAELLK